MSDASKRYEWYLKPPSTRHNFGSNSSWHYTIHDVIQQIIKDSKDHILYGKELIQYGYEFNDSDYNTRKTILQCSSDLQWFFNSCLNNFCYNKDSQTFYTRRYDKVNEGFACEVEFRSRIIIDPFTIKFKSGMFIGELKVIDDSPPL